jgi:hypothetical protein
LQTLALVQLHEPLTHLLPLLVQSPSVLQTHCPLTQAEAFGTPLHALSFAHSQANVCVLHFMFAPHESFVHVTAHCPPSHLECGFPHTVTWLAAFSISGIEMSSCPSDAQVSAPAGSVAQRPCPAPMATHFVDRVRQSLCFVQLTVQLLAFATHWSFVVQAGATGSATQR